MIKKKCANIREKFSDYIDEFLPETEMADLEMHIKNCPFCEKELEAYNKTVQALRNLPKYSIHPNIIVKINERIEQDKSWWQRLNNKGFKGVLGAVTAVILCVFGLQIFNNNTNKMNIAVVKVGDAANSSSSVVNKERESGRLAKNKSQRRASGKFAADKADNLMAPKRAQITDGDFRGKLSEALENSTPSSSVKAEQQQVNLPSTSAPGDSFAGIKAQDAAAASAPIAAKPLNEKDYDNFAPESRAEKKMLQVSKTDGQSKSSEFKRRKKEIVQTSFEQKGLYCNFTPAANNGPSAVVIKDKNTFKNFWKKHFFELTEPEINFKNEMLLAVFLGEQGSEPKDIVLNDIITEKNGLKVIYGTIPVLNTDTSGKKLSPYYMKTVKKNNLPVDFVKE